MTKHSTLTLFITLGMALLPAAVGAQSSEEKPEWVEESIAPPATFSTKALIPIEMPVYVSVKVGVEPTTVSVGKDGVVRYVVVMTNASGNTSSAFEGIRCTTYEVKTYARQSSAGQWSNASNPQWKSLKEYAPSRHALAIADQGACRDRLPPTVPEILAALREIAKLAGNKTH